MQKYETRIIVLPSNREERRKRLDEEGRKGWALVAVARVDYLEAYLQRPVNAGALYSEGDKS